MVFKMRNQLKDAEFEIELFKNNSTVLKMKGDFMTSYMVISKKEKYDAILSTYE